MTALARFVSRYGGILSLLLAGVVLLLFGLAFPPGGADANVILAATRHYFLAAALLLSLATIALFVARKPWLNQPSNSSIFQVIFAVLAFVAWCYGFLYARPL